MAPRATGAIETHAWRDGRTITVRARLRAYGRRYRIDFGTNHEGWSVERARVELDRILQQVERGTWEPPSRSPEATAELDGDETVHVTASRWWQRRKVELAPNTRLDYKWRLDLHGRFDVDGYAETRAVRLDDEVSILGCASPTAWIEATGRRPSSGATHKVNSPQSNWLRERDAQRPGLHDVGCRDGGVTAAVKQGVPHLAARGQCGHLVRPDSRETVDLNMPRAPKRSKSLGFVNLPAVCRLK